eukprot:CAMPEP_0176480804 /NCGR_PEP_ID=MMETSP0200_2-20121128/2475_1 /TAXON_ID=947934 /ORGANISM="Chaetoceros sp., Strain GSL56" /LENGTH=1523 /DNA_ID=CAMNT_0017876953 /DNA_START=627 /DNA_END=5195 /DNA_ORIENTATION=+
MSTATATTTSRSTPATSTIATTTADAVKDPVPAAPQQDSTKGANPRTKNHLTLTTTKTTTQSNEKAARLKAVTPRSMNSMTLAISRANAARMLEASQSLHAELVKLLKRQQEQPKQGVNPSNAPNELRGKESFCVDNLAQAAENTGNPLLTEFLSQMKLSVSAGVFSREEMMTCLLVFLDAVGKSQKLLFAFEQLSVTDKAIPQDQGTNNDKDTTNMFQKELSLDHEGVVKLFHCFLLSISTCIHYDGTGSVVQDTSSTLCDETKQENVASKDTCSDLYKTTAKVSVSPDLQDPTKVHPHDQHAPVWTLSEHVRRDILEIANYATSKLIQHIEESSKDKSTSSGNPKATDNSKSGTAPSDDTYVNGAVMSCTATTKKNPVVVSFQQFGEWYNKGGFSLVPWLELLDLNKWHVAGRATEQAKTGNVQKQQQRTLPTHQQGPQPKASTHGRGDNNVTSEKHHHPSKVPFVSSKNIAENDKGNHISSGSSKEGKETLKESQQGKQDKVSASNPSECAVSTKENCGHDANVPTLSSLPPPLDLSHQQLRFVFTCEFGDKKEFKLHLSGENLLMFEELVEKTRLNQSSPTHVSNILHQHAKPGTGICQGISVIHRQDLPNIVRSLVPDTISSMFTKQEMECFSTYFTIFFLSLARHANDSNFQSGAEQVITKELAVGFSFLCAGNKSQKLDECFKIMSDNDSNVLTQHKLLRFVRSYLRMILGMSLLSSSSDVNKHHVNALLGINPTSLHISSLCYTTEVGSNWILNNFLQHWNVKNTGTKSGTEKINFHDFADWYKNGGFNIASWLELLDLSKVNGLIGPDTLSGMYPMSKLSTNDALLGMPSSTKRALGFSPTTQPLNPPTSTGKIRSFDEFINGSTSPIQKEKKRRSLDPPQQFNPDINDILSTFPLSDGRSLIVLREDAAYVRSVVEQFGLLNCTPDSVWNKLSLHNKKHGSKALSKNKPVFDNCDKKCYELDQRTFVDGVMKSIPSKLRKKKSQPPLAATPRDTLENFFLSFDMNQVNKVAANQLMGGFSLFCSGSKTAKLSFIFSLFHDHIDDDKTKKKSENDAASGKEVFYFFRSILIVLFSCCKQSLMLTAGPVGQYIADAANKVTNDVMRYQWKTRKVDRINFDEFGEWYNKGGYEVAPWIELLDLEKWAFLDKDKAEKMLMNSKSDLDHQLKDKSSSEQKQYQSSPTTDKYVSRPFFSPRVSHDDGFDPFGTDIGDMGDIADIDCFDVDFGFDILPKVGYSSITGQSGTEPPQSPSAMQYSDLADNGCIASCPYQFKLSTDENNHRIASVSPQRVHLLKTILVESGLNKMNISNMCSHISNAANGSTIISRNQFDSAVEMILDNDVGKNMTSDVKKLCYSLFVSLFDQMVNFEGAAVTSEITCGLIVLCKGRKSEKLEFAFDVLDAKKNGQFCRSQMISFLRSFLTVIFYISSCELGDEPAQNILLPRGNSFEDHLEDLNIIMKVSEWVADSVFKATLDPVLDGSNEKTVNFDDFADWYTKGGHETNNWLELLDMEKW